MDAHIIEDVELKTTELIYRGKKYDVAFSLKVLNKLSKLPDDADEVDTVPKIISWLINDAIDREYILTGEKGEKVSEEEVSCFVGASNMNYYKKIMETAMSASLPEPEKPVSEDGGEIVVTDEMKEMFGEPEKN